MVRPSELGNVLFSRELFRLQIYLIWITDNSDKCIVVDQKPAKLRKRHFFKNDSISGVSTFFHKDLEFFSYQT